MTDVETPHELVLVNRYDASPEQVWAAWTDTEMFFTRLGEFLAR
jgi:uncharacterized protein YndB with AHSA1/START domain